MERDETVFTGVHQNMGWEKYKSRTKYVLESLQCICDQLRKCMKLQEAYLVLMSVDNIGLFLLRNTK